MGFTTTTYTCRNPAATGAMWRAAALLALLAVLASRPAAAARELQDIESSLPGAGAPAAVQSRKIWGAMVKASKSAFSSIKIGAPGGLWCRA